MNKDFRYQYYHRARQKTVTMRPVDLDKDMNLLFSWMNESHTIPNWKLNLSQAALFQHFQQVIASGYQSLFILAIDGEELCYAETYDASRDRLANYCKIQAGDYGIHLLIGPPQAIGQGYSEILLSALTDFLFQHHQAKRVLIEPNQTVKQLTILERKLGFTNLGPITLPEKIATLYAIEAPAFYRIYCDTSAWPLVKIHFPNYPHDHAVERWLQEVDLLLARRERCIVISTFDEHYQFSTLARRKQALWFKRNKHLLAQYCLGMVRVTRDEIMIAKITSNAMREGMPFTCIPASTLAEAEQIAQNLSG